MNTRRKVPASKCPHCDHLHTFDEVDVSDVPRRLTQLELGPQAVLVCQGCAQPLQLATNLTLTAYTEERFLRDPDLMAERWRVVRDRGLEPPVDLVEATIADTDGEVLVIETTEDTPLVKTMLVDPTEGGPVDYRYIVSITQFENIELVITGTYPATAEMLFQIVFSAWDQISRVAPGRRFSFEHGDGYEMVMAPILDPMSLDLPPGVVYRQLVCQDVDGFWPWDTSVGQADTPVISGSEWRPTDDGEDPVIISYQATPADVDAVVEVTETPGQVVDVSDWG